MNPLHGNRRFHFLAAGLFEYAILMELLIPSPEGGSQNNYEHVVSYLLRKAITAR